VLSTGVSKALVPAAAVLCLAGYVYVYATGRADQPIRSDGYSYYVYLPSWFIYGDPGLGAVARDCCGGQFPAFTAIIRWPGTRRWVNAHPIGVAVMQSPFFFTAHVLTRWSNLPPDGFSLYYQHAIGIAGLFWIVAGLWVLRDLMRRHFTDRVTAVALLALLLGTNLYHYATYDSAYSHAYSFFLIAAFLNLTERWHTRPSRGQAALLGLVFGLIVVTRHTNALVAVVFFLYGVTDLTSWRAAVSRFAFRWRDLAVIAGIAAIVLVPQLAIYYQATGQLFVNSYGGLGFSPLSPRLGGVLFGVQKGLFFWSPLLLAAVAGLVMARNSARAFTTGAVAFLILDTYVIASWWDWQFGGSYGHRGFVDTFPLLAIGLAEFFAWSARQPQRKLAVAMLVSVTIGLSVFQMLQYWNGALPISDVTWSDYRALFLPKAP
jgi:hypothetical protein